MSLIPVGNTQWYGPHMLAKTPGPYLAMRILPYNTVIKTWQMFSLSSLLRAIFRCKSSQPHYVSCKLYCCKLSCQSFIPFWLFFWNLPSFTFTDCFFSNILGLTQHVWSNTWSKMCIVPNPPPCTNFKTNFTTWASSLEDETLLCLL